MSSVRLAPMVCLAVMGVVNACLDRPLVESRPDTSNLFVDQVEQRSIDKIDLLFMVDNSASMADKQDILREAVPVLVSRLTSPQCVDPLTRVPTGEKSPCQHGEPEFQAVADIHVGIVTSSLGAHGGSQCQPMSGYTPDDKAHLLGTIRPAGGTTPGLAFDVSRTWNSAGFLAWDSGLRDVPPGLNDPRALQDTFQDMIASAGEKGCGYEASLESWYRFLVDPEPPLNVIKDDSQHTARGSRLITHADGSTSCEGCDLELLAQRKAFLRPDSLLAIVMLSDENDCSIRDDGAGWFVTTDSALDQNQVRYPVRMPRASAACANDPNDKCCRSCADASPTPEGCPALADDEICKTVVSGQPYAVWDALHDNASLRCFNQKQRFGVDLLYPPSRYVDALRSPTLTLQSDGKTKLQNPLFVPSAQGLVRDKSLVFLAGIVGVPWQDIADDASRTGPGLKYLTAADLVAKDRWSVLLGTPDASPPVPPSDPFMIESPTPRVGVNPITHDAIAAATSTSPTASPINGHEQNVPNLDDLQYACTFPLAKPRLCAPGDDACDCTAAMNGSPSVQVSAANRPLCQPLAGGAAGTQQNYAKAYPGTRELEVLKGLNEQGIVASICPKVTVSADRDSDPNYGYNPAVAAIIDRLKIALSGKCLPRAIQADPETHQVRCKVVEAQSEGCNCALPGRAPADPRLREAVERQLESTGLCGGGGQAKCSSFCQCEILQEVGPDLTACRLNQKAAPGFCYVDDPASSVLMDCPGNQKHALRFVSGDGPDRTPASGANTFIACLGAPLASAMP